MKTKIFNLIILDESGSMCGITPATISGCNETLSGIRSLQKEFADTQEHFISIYAFQDRGSRPSRYIVKNAPAAEVQDITRRDYDPEGCTPLLDAVGSTLADLKSITKTHDQAIGNITIITDGLENASRQYTFAQVAMLIDQLKEIGWKFSFIGANIDVDAVADTLHIKDRMSFKQDDAGTREMFARQQEARGKWGRRFSFRFANMPKEEDFDALCKAMAEEEENINYFNAPDEPKK